MNRRKQAKKAEFWLNRAEGAYKIHANRPASDADFGDLASIAALIGEGWAHLASAPMWSKPLEGTLETVELAPAAMLVAEQLEQADPFEYGDAETWSVLRITAEVLRWYSLIPEEPNASWTTYVIGGEPQVHLVVNDPRSVSKIAAELGVEVNYSEHGGQVHIRVESTVGGWRCTATVIQDRPPAEPEPGHREMGGTAGGPGECGVECACGVGFYGFDTMAEAHEQLDRHIAFETPALRGTVSISDVRDWAKRTTPQKWAELNPGQRAWAVVEIRRRVAEGAPCIPGADPLWWHQVIDQAAATHLEPHAAEDGGGFA